MSPIEKEMDVSQMPKEMVEQMLDRFPALRSILKAPALTLVENGRVLERNLRKEMLCREELMSQLREEGVEDLSAVKVARLEGDGRLSVIKTENR